MLTTASLLYSADELKIVVLRVDFPEDEITSTTGNGKFLLEDNLICGDYTIDPPPHDKSYFESQLIALDNYYSAVSNGKFGIDLTNSSIYPLDNNSGYTLPNEMSYYHPALLNLSDEERAEKHEELLVELFSDALHTANNTSTIDFGKYDLVVVIHAGVGQEIVFNELIDTSAEDIPTTFIDNQMIKNHTNNNGINVGNDLIKKGIVLPETQNYILFPEVVEDQIDIGVENYCYKQNGLTGTFAMFVGQAIGFPPLWNTESGASGIGIFGLMDIGSNNGQGLIPAPPSAWNRVFMGWEEAEIIIPDKMVDVVSRPNGNIYKVDINSDEYFLIENRTNWFRSIVSIDSARWAVNSRVDTLPTTIEMIFDSVGVERDDNGVVVSVPDYDLGLPGSGLLIWHIDEPIISENISNYSINGDINRKGVDLEEASGAQNIGYNNTHGVTGEYFDMWFQGNWLFEENNSLTRGNPLEFNSMTYPNTNSNDGALSNIRIGNIGYPSDTMQIAITNNLMLSGFPDTSLHVLYHTNIIGDGNYILIGGRDSLWWSNTGKIQKNYFYEMPSKNNLFTFTNLDNSKNLVVLSDLGDSLKIAWFEFDDTLKIKQTKSINMDINSINYISGSFSSDDIQIIENDIEIISEIELGNRNAGLSTFVKIFSDGGIIIGDQASKYSEIKFNYVSAIDMDLDGIIEVLAVDDDGKLYAFNQNYTYANGFPLDIDAVPPILSKNILGDTKPEIIFLNGDGEIVILNNVGEVQYRLSNQKNDTLVLLGEYEGKNTIVSESSIWIFDDITDNLGNEWISYYGDEINSNSIKIDYDPNITSQGGLIDKKQTYVYPNPVRDGKAKIRIFNNSADKIEIKIYDAAGYFVEEMSSDIETKNGVWETIWDVSNVESGVYLLHLNVSSKNSEDSAILKVGVIH